MGGGEVGKNCSMGVLFLFDSTKLLSWALISVLTLIE